MNSNHSILTLVIACLTLSISSGQAESYEVSETEQQIEITTTRLKAAIRKKGYVSGVAGGSFVDRKTGFHDAGFGLDIVDFLLEPGSDKAYRERLPEQLTYHYGNKVHGDRPKRKVEGPQICTKAGELDPQVIRGEGFVGVTQRFTYTLAAPGYKAGSTWTQRLVFPEDKRYFVSMDRIHSVNASNGLFLRIDMPGHVRHDRGDTFSEIYLSYIDEARSGDKFTDGRVPASEFFRNFPPDGRFNYRRDRVEELPERFIRAYRLRDPKTGEEGPWLAGMTLDPEVVYEAWCHQRGYVCMILEVGGRPIEASESFSAAHIVGYFDSIEQMKRVYDKYCGHRGLKVNREEWHLTESTP